MTPIRPLTGAFFTYVVSFIHMNIPFELRPVSVRLQLAYIADAVHKFSECEPDNTYVRQFHNGGCHPYTRMWETIHKYYDANRWYEMSDVEIANLWTTMCTVGIDDGDTHIDGIDVLRVKQRWETNGWNRYERKRNGRRSVVFKYAPLVVLACFGIQMPDA
tara:strand:+ start:1785 stop:2267 length:483 start_codon:yes stop_codon:yes gene_type:complete